MHEFWSNLPATILALGGFVTALATLIAALRNNSKLNATNRKVDLVHETVNGATDRLVEKLVEATKATAEATARATAAGIVEGIRQEKHRVQEGGDPVT